MKTKLLAAAALSLGVGAADADNEGNANTNEGNANTRYTQTIREAPDVPPRGYPAARCSTAEGLAAKPTVDPALLTRSAGHARPPAVLVDEVLYSSSASSSQAPRTKVATSIDPSSAHRMLSTFSPWDTSSPYGKSGFVCCRSIA